jgi:hypothetical protein
MAATPPCSTKNPQCSAGALACAASGPTHLNSMSACSLADSALPGPPMGSTALALSASEAERSSRGQQGAAAGGRGRHIVCTECSITSIEGALHHSIYRKCFCQHTRLHTKTAALKTHTPAAPPNQPIVQQPARRYTCGTTAALLGSPCSA